MSSSPVPAWIDSLYLVFAKSWKEPPPGDRCSVQLRLRWPGAGLFQSRKGGKRQWNRPMPLLEVYPVYWWSKCSASFPRHLPFEPTLRSGTGRSLSADLPPCRPRPRPYQLFPSWPPPALGKRQPGPGW